MKKLFHNDYVEKGGQQEFKVNLKNIAKGTTDPRVEFISQIFIKFHFQNLD